MRAAGLHLQEAAPRFQQKEHFLETFLEASPTAECSLASCLPHLGALYALDCNLCEVRDCVLSVVESGDSGHSGRACGITSEQPTGAELGSGVAFKIEQPGASHVS